MKIKYLFLALGIFLILAGASLNLTIFNKFNGKMPVYTSIPEDLIIHPERYIIYSNFSEYRQTPLWFLGDIFYGFSIGDFLISIGKITFWSALVCIICIVAIRLIKKYIIGNHNGNRK